MIFGSDRKQRQSSGEKGHIWKESGVTAQGKKEVKVGSLLPGNDQHNVIANQVLHYL